MYPKNQYANLIEKRIKETKLKNLHPSTKNIRRYFTQEQKLKVCMKL